MTKLHKWYNDDKKYTLENLDSEDLCVIAFALKLQRRYGVTFVGSGYPNENDEDYEVKKDMYDTVLRRIEKGEALKEQLERKNPLVKDYDTMV